MKIFKYEREMGMLTAAIEPIIFLFSAINGQNQLLTID